MNGIDTSPTQTRAFACDLNARRVVEAVKEKASRRPVRAAANRACCGSVGIVGTCSAGLGRLGP